jgi:hypothetical protein
MKGSMGGFIDKLCVFDQVQLALFPTSCHALCIIGPAPMFLVTPIHKMAAIQNTIAVILLGNFYTVCSNIVVFILMEKPVYQTRFSNPFPCPFIL